MTVMQQLSESQASPEIVINENFVSLEHHAVYGKDPDTTTGLTWGYLGGRWGGISVSAGTLSLTNATTNYIVVHRTTGAITVSTSATNWNATTTYARVYKLTTAGSAVTATEDHRSGPNGVHGMADIAGGAIDASAVTYTPATEGDWDGSSDPGNVDDALDELAARVVDLETAPGGGRHAIWVAAGSITPSATGGCATLATVATSANQPDLQTLNFDSSTAEYAQFSIHMPKSWNEGTVTFAPVWSHPSTTTNFGVVWGLQAVGISNDDAIATNYGTAQTSTDTGGTTDDLYIGPESSAITVGGSPAAEDVVFFRVYRDPTAGSDTMAVDARLHGITVYITTDSDTDA